jgi:3-oxoacyl-[acyl-carrier protein] reductase
VNAKIVIIGGLTGINLLDNHPNSGVIRLMWLAKAKELSRVLADRKIHVNTISLGGTLTESFKQGIMKRANQNNRTLDEQMAIEVKDIPLKSYGTPLQIAEIVRFLLMKESDYITGTNLVVDGGFHRNY